MLSCASVDAQRNYKPIRKRKAPKTPIDKGYSLAHTCAEHAHAHARALGLATLALGRLLATLASSPMRRNVLGTQGAAPPAPPDRSTPAYWCRLRGRCRGAKRHDPASPTASPFSPGSALSGSLPAKARRHIA